MKSRFFSTQSNDDPLDKFKELNPNFIELGDSEEDPVLEKDFNFLPGLHTQRQLERALRKRALRLDATIGTDGETLIFQHLLCKMARHKKLHLIKILLANYGDLVNSSNKFGDRAIHYSAKMGDLDLLKILVEHGADVNAVNELGWTPFYVACASGHLHIVQYLVGFADLDTIDFSGETPLHAAGVIGSVEIIKILLATEIFEVSKQSLFNGFTAAQYAQFNGHEEAAELLGSCRADYRRLEIFEILEEAICEKRIESIEGLFNSSRPQTLTLLSYHLFDAVISNDVEIAKFLFKIPGIDPMIRDAFGRTAQSLATKWNYSGIIKLFIVWGAADDEDVDLVEIKCSHRFPRERSKKISSIREILAQ